MNFTDKIYFPGLNGLRFIAASAVLAGHIEFIKFNNNLPNFFYLSYFKNDAGFLGVILFFVLSGFLITYLLLSEKSAYGNISLKKFYIRRILRIWPLFFLIIFITIPYFFFFSQDSSLIFDINFWIGFILFSFFLPNLAPVLGYSLPGLYHLWSIGVEEQFYIIWPVFIKKIKKRLLHFLVIIFVIFSLAPHITGYTLNHFFHNSKCLFYLTEFLIKFKINCMALGGIAAYLCFTKNKFVNLIKNGVFEIIIFILTFVLWLYGLRFSVFNEEIYAIFFTIIIINISTKPKPFITLENKIFNYLGKISYGIYIYHILVITILINTLKIYFITYMYSHEIIINIFLYVFSFGITILISSFSYELYEKKFLNFKKKYSNIISVN